MMGAVQVILIGSRATALESMSTMTRMPLLPDFVFGSDPMKSMLYVVNLSSGGSMGLSSPNGFWVDSLFLWHVLQLWT